jgi:chromosome segregation ATPase
MELIDGRDAAGWKAQWEQLKAELDTLNPVLDTLKAQQAEGDQRSLRLQAQIETAASAYAALQAENDALKQEIAQAQETIAQLQQQATKAQSVLDEAAAAREAAKALAESRRLALSDVMRLVAAVHDKIGPLLTE